MNMSGFPSFRIDSSIYVEKNELKKWIARMKTEIFPHKVSPSKLNNYIREMII